MEEFIGNNYNIPQLDLSERPENTPEKYAYLYEQGSTISVTRIPCCLKTAIF